MSRGNKKSGKEKVSSGSKGEENIVKEPPKTVQDIAAVLTVFSIESALIYNILSIFHYIDLRSLNSAFSCISGNENINMIIYTEKKEQLVFFVFCIMSIGMVLGTLLYNAAPNIKINMVQCLNREIKYPGWMVSLILLTLIIVMSILLNNFSIVFGFSILYILISMVILFYNRITESAKLLTIIFISIMFYTFLCIELFTS